MAELTQLEKEVLTHPSVQYFLEHPLSELKLSDWGLVASGKTFNHGQFKDSAAKPILPSRIGKDWDLFSAHFRSLLVLLAKIQRDKKNPHEETLAQDLIDKLGKLYKYCFRWENEKHYCEVMERREGDMNILAINAEQLIPRQLNILQEIIRQHIKSLPTPSFCQFAHHQPKLKKYIHEYDARYHFLLVDIPDITQFIAKIPRNIQRKIRIIRFCIPKIYQQEMNEAYDVLASRFYLAIFKRQYGEVKLPPIIRQLKAKKLLCFKPKYSTEALLIYDPNFPSTGHTDLFGHIHSADLFFIES